MSTTPAMSDSLKSLSAGGGRTTRTLRFLQFCQLPPIVARFGDESQIVASFPFVLPAPAIFRAVYVEGWVDSIKIKLGAKK